MFASGDKRVEKTVKVPYGVKDSATKVRKEYDAKIYNGSSYDKYGSRKSGMYSVQDQQIIEENKQKRTERIGTGSYAFQVIDENGNPANSPQSINVNGKVFSSNAKGVLRFVDRKFFDEELEQIRQQNAYINQIMEMAVYDDDLTAKLLHLTREDFLNLCKANKGVDTASGALNAHDCTPSLLQSYEGSVYNLAVAKLRSIVKAYLPILSEENTTEETAEGK